MSKTLNELANECHQIAVEHGFWETERNNGELIALIHSELSELLEEMRKPEIDPEKVAEELADVFIRGMDFAIGRKINLEAAITQKMEINKNRPYKHGKKF